MTEQEKRIKELYDKFKKWANENFTISYSGATVMSVPSVEALLTRIALYISLKEEDVRKETVKEFIGFVENIIYNYKPTVTETDSGIKNYHYLTNYQLLDIIKEKYEKEIKE